jgi:Ca2+-binding RTX toxin-like protein
LGVAFEGAGSGNNNIISGHGNDQLTGNGGRDVFVCGEGEDIQSQTIMKLKEI